MVSAPQRLIIEKPINQYALYAAMFCVLHSSISKKQHEAPLHHYGNTEDSLMKRAPNILMQRLDFSNFELVS